MPIAFTKIVRGVVAESRADWRFLRAARRGGQCVDFALPATDRRFRQTMFFHEQHLGRSLVPTIRPEVNTVFVGKNHVAGIDGRDGRRIRFRDSNELRAAVAQLLPVVDRLAAAAIQAHAREATRLAKLFDRLGGHFKRWFGTVGSKLPVADFDEDEIGAAAFEAFHGWLGRERLLVASADPALWHWWRDGDPCAPETWGRRARLNSTVRAAVRQRV